MASHRVRPDRSRRTLAYAIATTLVVDALAVWGLTQPPPGAEHRDCQLVALTTLYCR